jgi:hypothetical protein
VFFDSQARISLLGEVNQAPLVENQRRRCAVIVGFGTCCSEAGSNCVATPPNRELSEPFGRLGILVYITMLINEQMKEFNDSFRDLFRFSTVSALNCPCLMLSSSIASQDFFLMSNRPWPTNPASSWINCEPWRSNSSSCRPGSKRSKHKQQKMLRCPLNWIP